MGVVQVRGQLSDFSNVNIPNALVPVLEFHPSQPSRAASRLLTSKPIKAILNGESWIAELNETELIVPAAWYTAVIRWFAPGGQFQYEDRLPEKIYVPIGGGAIGAFPTKPNPGSIVAGFGKPEPRHSASAYFDLLDVTPEGVMLYLPKGSV